MEYTRQLAQFAVQLKYSDIPSDVIEKAKEFALHAWGVQLACSTLPWSKSVFRYTQGQGGNPHSTVLNYGLKTSTVNAAFTNGAFGHGFEMDDNHAATSTKCGSVVIPAALAIGEQHTCSGQDFILATVIAVEIMTRVALSVTPALSLRGIHPTGSCGPFGAAASTGKLLGFDESMMLNALSIAGAHSAGLQEAPPSGRGHLKRIFGGMASASGVRAGLLAAEGLTGPDTMLEGEKGFCRAFGNSLNLIQLTSGLGVDWQIQRIHYKIYAQDGYIQPMSEALGNIMQQHVINPNEIEEIVAGTNGHAHNQVIGLIREPKDLTSAQFSANFSLALFIIKGNAGFHEYSDESLSDPRIIELSKRIRTEIDDEVELEWQKSKPRGARITIRMKSGAIYTEYIHNLRSMTNDDVNKKFLRLANVALPSEKCESLLHISRNLETVKDISKVASLLAK